MTEPAEMNVTAQGIAILERDTHVSRWVRESGRLDHDRMVDRIVDLIPEGGTVVEGGANIGSHTVAYAKKVGALGRVIAIEPHPESFECLRYNCASYPWVKLCNVGLSAEGGARWLLCDDNNIGASYLSAKPGGRPVQCMTIDGLDLPTVDLIKLDVEGMELEALKGGRNTIDRCRPVLVLEVNHGALRRAGTSREALFAWLREAGYEWSSLSGPDDKQYDIVAKAKQ